MSQTTKKMMAITLKKMMQNTPFDKITVVHLVEECEINRQTFYYHFQDIYDLLGWIYKNEALLNINDYKSQDTWQEGFLKIFLYVKDNDKFCLNTLNSIAKEHLDNFLYEITFELLINVVKEISKGQDVKEKELRFIANFYSFAFIGILINWMKEGMKENPQDIVNEIDKLIGGNVERMFKK